MLFVSQSVRITRSSSANAANSDRMPHTFPRQHLRMVLKASVASNYLLMLLRSVLKPRCLTTSDVSMQLHVCLRSRAQHRQVLDCTTLYIPASSTVLR